jgi:hypothetical protein
MVEWFPTVSWRTDWWSGRRPGGATAIRRGANAARDDALPLRGNQ